MFQKCKRRNFIAVATHLTVNKPMVEISPLHENIHKRHIWKVFLQNLIVM